jgi:hypothetical protein
MSNRVVIGILLFEPILTNPQATVVGTVVGVEVFLNRDTRDSLSVAERSYLHDSFKYTGGGLALTALAARSMFKAGLPFRIMAANPCEHFGTGGADILLTSIFQGSCLASVLSAASVV